MQIVIPMSGKGERFKKVGFESPKPLIEVNGKPIIAHILDLFEGETDFIFICDREHLKKTRMQKIIKKYCPQGRIIPIEPHNLGPVYAVTQAFKFIKDNEPTIVNYADFSCYWNYKHFKKWLDTCNPDGCIPAYRGFHPHSLIGNNYAFMKVEHGWMSEIQEKKPFTSNEIDEFASSGTYYFSKGRLLKKFFKDTISKKLLVNNEYYCSVAYNLMVEAGFSVAVYELQHFMQWGTPEDLTEYLKWSNAFEALTYKTNQNSNLFEGTTLIPMAGRGSRFVKENYKTHKSQLLVSGNPMVIQAAKSLPKTKKYHFVALKETYFSNNLEKIISNHFSNAKISLLKEVSNGPADTCLSALDSISLDEPLTISACDHGIIYDHKKFYQLFNNKKVDIVVWVDRGHPNAIRTPEQYGWVKTNGKEVESVFVKSPLDNPQKDPLIVGTFTFKTAEIFKKCAQNLIYKDIRVNNEHYVDSCINEAISIGYKCFIFEVEHFFCWGNPNDLKTFQYWQSCFHKWQSHPYLWSKDNFRKNFKEINHMIPIHIKEVNSNLPKLVNKRK